MMENTMVVEPPPPALDSWRAPARRLLVWSAFSLVAFSVPLFQLGQFSLFSKQSDFYSYIPLIPFVSAYLFWISRHHLPPRPNSSLVLGAILGVSGLAFAICGVIGRMQTHALEETAYFALMTAGFLLILAAGAAVCLGAAFLRAFAFPVFMLLFAVPPPEFVLAPIISFLQITSAYTATCFFWLARTPHLSQGTLIRLPNIPLEVAPECSGIHSTMVLLITSFLAGHLFLRASWRKAVLVLAVLPLAILRNGFRVFVIGELCVHISPTMIDSPIHRKGGPLFFALSLIPFFLLLLWLRRSETKKSDS